MSKRRPASGAYHDPSTNSTRSRSPARRRSRARHRARPCWHPLRRCVHPGARRRGPGRSRRCRFRGQGCGWRGGGAEGRKARQGGFNQDLGFGARNQHIGRHGEHAPVELAALEQVRDRVADGALRDQHVDARVLGLGEHAHAVGDEVGAIDARRCATSTCASTRPMAAVASSSAAPSVSIRRFPRSSRGAPPGARPRARR
jgi:hypothetical protein